MNGIRSEFLGVFLAAAGLVAGSSFPCAQRAREVGLADLPPELFATLHCMFPPTEGAVRGAGFGDVDGDGDPDLILLAREGNRLFLDDGEGGFELATGRLPDAASRRSVALAFCDVDGDGDLDLFLANTASSSQLLLNDGAGRFTDVTDARFLVSIGVANSVATGDVDGDLDLDLLVGKTGQNLLYLNDGLGFFADASSGLPALLDLTLDVALGDVEDDGDLDAFVANSGGGVYTDPRNQLLLNDGNGVFVLGTAALPGDADQSLDAALADLDGDDLPDIVVANEGICRLYLNDGAGGFLDATGNLPGGPDPSYGVALGDVDGDTDLDVVFANNQLDLVTHVRGARNRLLLNDGAAAFQEATSQLASVLDVTHSTLLEDVDGDGDLDLFAANEDPSVLQLNAGDGSFSVAGLPLTFHDVTNAAALGDMDGDGDPDLVTGNGSPASMFHPAYEPENRLYLYTAGRFDEAPGRLPPDEDVHSWRMGRPVRED